jgi:hypothetical protein
MTTNKFLTFLSNKIQYVTAIASSAGVGDANKIIATGSDGLISSTLMPTGIGADTQSVVASENLSAGDWVNVYDNAGTPNVRKADANPERACTGYVLASVSSAASAIVYRSGTNTGRTGLTTGTYYYLSATAGSETATAPTTSGDVIQGLGYAGSSTTIAFQPTTPIAVA